MTQITASMVKDLRDRTGAGMMDAKKALEENGGDIEKAIDWLRQKGGAKAAKKSGRITAEGAVVAATTGSWGVVIEINTETDFAARNENFTNFTKAVLDAAVAAKAGTLDAVKALKLADGNTVEATITNLVATTGENMTLRRVNSLQADTVGAYVHMGGKIGVLTAITGAADLATVAKQVAMHVAASAPASLDRSSIDPQTLAREKAVFEAQAAESGKPAAVVEKMVQGRINKYLEEVCLVEQPFVMDPDRKVGQVVDQAHKGATVTAFVRYGLGEGIEKEVTDFAAEVAAQVAASQKVA
jgi:elongation factor Ts